MKFTESGFGRAPPLRFRFGEMDHLLPFPARRNKKPKLQPLFFWKWRVFEMPTEDVTQVLTRAEEAKFRLRFENGFIIAEPPADFDAVMRLATVTELVSQIGFVRQRLLARAVSRAGKRYIGCEILAEELGPGRLLSVSGSGALTVEVQHAGKTIKVLAHPDNTLILASLTPENQPDAAAWKARRNFHAEGATGDLICRAESLGFLPYFDDGFTVLATPGNVNAETRQLTVKQFAAHLADVRKILLSREIAASSGAYEGFLSFSKDFGLAELRGAKGGAVIVRRLSGDGNNSTSLIQGSADNMVIFPKQEAREQGAREPLPPPKAGWLRMLGL